MTSSVNSNELVEQIQTSHRIVVAFYRRILPVFDAIADAFNCDFAYWKPNETQRPCRGDSQPSRSWAWDFVPLFASNHQYTREKGDKTSPDDLGIELDLYLDDNLKKAKREKLGFPNGRQPGGISLPKGKAVVEVHIYRPKEAGNKSLSKLWTQCERPKVGDETFHTIGSGIEGAAFQVLLEEVIADHQVVINKIRTILGAGDNGKTAPAK